MKLNYLLREYRKHGRTMLGLEPWEVEWAIKDISREFLRRTISSKIGEKAAQRLTTQIDRELCEEPPYSWRWIYV